MFTSPEVGKGTEVFDFNKKRIVIEVLSNPAIELLC
jgi:hypothetical protein